jgi:flavodoxin
MAEMKSILVLFGSETGNCESISKRIHQEALGAGYGSKWHKFSDFKKVGNL